VTQSCAGTDPSESNRFVVRAVEADDEAFIPALVLASDGAPSRGSESAIAQAREMIQDAARRSLIVAPVIAAFEGDRIVASAFALESPGRAALVFTSRPSRLAFGSEAWIETISTLRRTALSRRNLLLEMLLAPGDRQRAELLPAAGFRKITRLSYLRRPTIAEPVKKTIEADLNWTSYSPKSHPLFVKALRSSYTQSLDCPELAQLRSIDEVIEGHRAAGEFDAALWQTIHRAEEPLGIILLSRIPGQPAVEIVYMGVAPGSRGRGVSDALLARAVELASTTACATTPRTPQELVLAVDERNAPALRLYARWGFGPIGERDAWIATSHGARG